jgi:predicted dinucleotide-binding enzyme
VGLRTGDLLNISVLGTGMVGQAIGEKVRERGHDVRTASRQAKDSFVTFADAAKHGENVRSDARATPIASRPRSMGSTSTMVEPDI